jgi:chloramphenicol 3-O phosphotransferase
MTRVSDAPPPGQVIFLNGTSSSGKSAIAGALRAALSRPFFRLSVDAVNAVRARQRTAELPPGELPAVLRRTRAGSRRAAAGVATAGDDLVVDYVPSEPSRLADPRLHPPARPPLSRDPCEIAGQRCQGAGGGSD